MASSSSVNALIAFTLIACGASTSACQRATDDDDNSQPILDIQHDTLATPRTIRIQVHGAPRTQWCLGVQLSSGLLDHAGTPVSSDCTLLMLDDNGNGQYAAVLVDGSTNVPAALLVELSSGCAIDSGLPDAGVGAEGAAVNSGHQICPGPAPLRDRVLALGMFGSAAVDAAADVPPAADAGMGDGVLDVAAEAPLRDASGVEEAGQ